MSELRNGGSPGGLLYPPAWKVVAKQERPASKLHFHEKSLNCQYSEVCNTYVNDPIYLEICLTCAFDSLL